MTLKSILIRHSKTYILREILIKKHKLKAVEAYVYFSKIMRLNMVKENPNKESCKERMKELM